MVVYNLVSICSFPKYSIARTNQGFEAASRSAYSSSLVGFKQYGRIDVANESDGCAVIVVLRFFMSAIVDTPDSNRAFSVRQTANTPYANLIPRLFVWVELFNTALDAEP
jgi:hypothetical protein